MMTKLNVAIMAQCALSPSAGFSPEKKSSTVSVYNTAGWGAGCTGIPSPSQNLKNCLKRNGTCSYCDFECGSQLAAKTHQNQSQV